MQRTVDGTVNAKVFFTVLAPSTVFTNGRKVLPRLDPVYPISSPPAPPPLPPPPPPPPPPAPTPPPPPPLRLLVYLTRGVSRVRSLCVEARPVGNNGFPGDPAFVAMAANAVTLLADRPPAPTTTATASCPFTTSRSNTTTTTTTATTTTSVSSFPSPSHPPPPPPPPLLLPHQGVFAAAAAFARRPDP